MPEEPENENAPATKRDVKSLKGDVESLKGDVASLKGDVASLKGDVASLKGHVESLDRRVESLKGDVESVKQDLTDYRAATKQEFEQVRSEAAHQYNDIIERISDSETKLLKAFYSFGQSNSKRMTEVEGNEAALRSRIATLEDRLMEVEKRLNIPPAA